MPFDKSVVVPLDPAATFALITQPDRLRRWMTVAARVDLRAGGEYRWTVTPGHIAAGTIVDVDPGKRVIVHVGVGGRRRSAAGRVDRDGHADPGRRRHRGPAGARRPDRGAGRPPRRGVESLPRQAGGCGPSGATPVPTNGRRHPIRSTNCPAPRRHWRFCSMCCAVLTSPTCPSRRRVPNTMFRSWPII